MLKEIQTTGRQQCTLFSPLPHLLKHNQGPLNGPHWNLCKGDSLRLSRLRVPVCASVQGSWVRATSLKPVSSASALTRSGAHAHTPVSRALPFLSHTSLPPSMTSNYPELSLGPTGKALQQAYSSSSQPSHRAARGRKAGWAGRQVAGKRSHLAGRPTPCHPRLRVLCVGRSTSQLMLTSQGLGQPWGGGGRIKIKRANC